MLNHNGVSGSSDLECEVQIDHELIIPIRIAILQHRAARLPVIEAIIEVSRPPTRKIPSLEHVYPLVDVSADRQAIIYRILSSRSRIDILEMARVV